MGALVLVLGGTFWWAATDQERQRAEAQASASASPPPPQYSTRDSEIAFTSSEGQGVLRVNKSTRQGDRLVVNLTISSTAGNLSYSFAGFDETGHYVEADYDTPDPALTSGYVDEGHEATGNVAFHPGPGAFTLTMMNDAGESVTALPVR